MPLERMDKKFINFCKNTEIPFARLGLFIVFFWFGILKVTGLSPASPLVQALFENTIPFMSFNAFLISFGLFECLIGILFIIRGVERLALSLLFIHMITTFGPLVFLPEETWQSFLVPTLAGQYIIKNLLILAVGISIASHLEPIRENNL